MIKRAPQMINGRPHKCLNYLIFGKVGYWIPCVTGSQMGIIGDKWGYLRSSIDPQ